MLYYFEKGQDPRIVYTMTHSEKVLQVGFIDYLNKMSEEGGK